MQVFKTGGLLVLATVITLAVGEKATRACFMRSPMPVQVWLDHITVDITDQVTVKTYNCTFKNANPQAVVGGTCYLSDRSRFHWGNLGKDVGLYKVARGMILRLQNPKLTINNRFPPVSSIMMTT